MFTIGKAASAADLSITHAQMELRISYTALVFSARVHADARQLIDR